jgi:hypothetical protein
VFSPSISAPSPSFSIVKITLSGFPHQIGESVTNIGLSPSPCRVTCSGFSNIVIHFLSERTSPPTPVTVQGGVSVTVLATSLTLIGIIDIPEFGFSHPFRIIFPPDNFSSTERVFIAGIGTGQVNFQIS